MFTRLIMTALLLVATAAAHAETIRFINLEGFLKSADLLTSRYAQLEKEVSEFNGWAKGKQRELEKLDTQLRLLKEGSAKFDDVRLKMALLREELKIKQQQAGERFKRAENEELQKALADMRGLLQKYCADKGIDLVIRYNAVGEKSMFGDVTSLYANPEMDITADFLVYANESFSAAPVKKEAEETAIPEVVVPGQ